ncbi:Protein of unknown function (DUF3592) [Parafrankia irregularis]|uniref:DUF3592 domain-containing protein n=2 Tax=Parafrankia irregularis TaxID=795642 RepID=A0A0S4QYY4_9ACTN|nr:DUF3592 domain-containing protein [Parafrankia sp. CH37]CUU59658.1 Protein of unknown function (DUF3592) [Parafrankia irregularis]
MGLIGKVIGCIIMIGFGCALVLNAVAGMKAFLERIWLRVRGNYVTGTVVDVDVVEDPDRYTQYTPTVEFVTRRGERRVEKVLYATINECSVGDRVRVFYRPHDQTQVFVADFSQGLWIILFFPFLVAGGLTMASLGVLILIGVDEVHFGGGRVLDLSPDVGE